MEKQILEKYQNEVSDLGERLNHSISMLIEETETDALNIGEAIFEPVEFILSYIKDCPIERKMYILKQLL